MFASTSQAPKRSAAPCTNAANYAALSSSNRTSRSSPRIATARMCVRSNRQLGAQAGGETAAQYRDAQVSDAQAPDPGLPRPFPPPVPDEPERGDPERDDPEEPEREGPPAPPRRNNAQAGHLRRVVKI